MTEVTSQMTEDPPTSRNRGTTAWQAGGSVRPSFRFASGLERPPAQRMSPLLNVVAKSRAMRSLVVSRKPR